MNFHFAGNESNPKRAKFFNEKGAKNTLESFWSLQDRSPTPGFNLLLDSGGFVARTQGVKIRVQELARYIRKNEIKIAFELDTNDMKETAYNREYLIANTKAKIIPIYHYSTFKSGNEKFLFELMDRFDYIGLGGVVGGVKSTRQEKDEFFNFIFRNTRDKWKTHGLGITDPYSMKKFPFFSVDSTQWLDSLRFGKFSYDREDELKWVKETKSEDFKLINEIGKRVKLETYVTNLWKARGVIWQPLNL